MVLLSMHKAREMAATLFLSSEKVHAGAVFFHLLNLYVLFTSRLEYQRLFLVFLLFAEISSFHILRLRKNCEENRMICERFLSDYREIFEAEPRKSRDNHSKTSNRSSCVPNSLFEKS